MSTLTAPAYHACLFDFFAGMGGATSGFREAGFKPVYATDVSPQAARTYLANFPDVPFEQADMRSLDPHTALLPALRRWRAEQPGKPVLFAASPPYAPFSPGAPQHDADLLLRLADLTALYEPEYLFVELLPYACHHRLWTPFLSRLQRAGYGWTADCQPLWAYGVPQQRRRVLLLGARGADPQSLPFRYAPPLSVDDDDNVFRPAWKTVRDTIGWLPALRAGETHPQIPEHRAARLSDLNLKRIRHTPQGGDWNDWPASLQPNRERLKGAGGRLQWDLPSAALTVRCLSYPNGRHGHPEQDRAISILEASLLQTFPLGYHLPSTLTWAARHLSHALPPAVARLHGNWILNGSGGLQQHLPLDKTAILPPK